MRYTSLLALILTGIFYISASAETGDVAGSDVPSTEGRLSASAWNNVLSRGQTYLESEKVDAFINLANSVSGKAPVGMELDGELLSAQALYHSGRGAEAYTLVKKMLEPVLLLPIEERRNHPLLAKGWLKNFLIRIASRPIITREEKLEGKAEGATGEGAALVMYQGVVLHCLDLLWAVNLCDLYRSLDDKGFREITKALDETFKRKRTFYLAYRNHGRVEITPERASDQALISLYEWAKPTLPNSIARQIQIYWGLEMFSNCLSRRINIYDITYAIARHVTFAEGKIAYIDSYGTEDLDRGYRAYAETSGRLETSLEETLAWMGIKASAWHAVIVSPKAVKTEATEPEATTPEQEKKATPVLPTHTPDFQ